MRSGQLNIPIRRVNELSPRGVSPIGQPDGHDRVAGGLDGFANEVQVRLGGRSTTFSDVALHASAHHIGPRRRSAARTRNDVIKAELRCREAFTAILTGVAIAREKIAPIELHFLSRQTGKREDAHDAGDDQMNAHRPDPVMFSRLEFALERADLRPVTEVVGHISSIFNIDHLRNRLAPGIALGEQGKRTPHADDAQCHIVGVKQQDAAVENRVGWDTDNRCEDRTSPRLYSALVGIWPTCVSSPQAYGVPCASDTVATGQPILTRHSGKYNVSRLPPNG